MRRAILEGLLAPGAAVLSSRALAADLGVSRTTTLLAFEQLTAEGYLTAQRGSGTYVAAALPDDLARVRVARMPTRLTHPPVSRRGAALAATPAGGRARAGSAARVPHRRPGARSLPGAALDTARHPASALDHARSARLRRCRPALPALREAIADHVRTARGTTCTADQVFVVAGAQRGLELVCRMLLDPGDRAVMEDPGYPGARSALVSAGAQIVHGPVDEDGMDVEAIARQPPGRRASPTSPRRTSFRSACR